MLSVKRRHNVDDWRATVHKHIYVYLDYIGNLEYKNGFKNLYILAFLKMF